MFCNNCGTKNPDDANYCSRCGARMNVPETKDLGIAHKTPRKSSEKNPDKENFRKKLRHSIEKDA